MVAFGTISVGIGYVLAGRISKGIQLLESAITTYDARGEVIATYTRIPSRRFIWKCSLAR